jgi:hypothetical protein
LPFAQAKDRVARRLRLEVDERESCDTSKHGRATGTRFTWSRRTGAASSGATLLDP